MGISSSGHSVDSATGTLFLLGITTSFSHVRPRTQNLLNPKFESRFEEDVELEKLIDWVNHEILIARQKKSFDGAGIIRMVRSYLNSGIMQDDLIQERQKVTPQYSIVDR
jgi:retron-type reverse transcriptase